MSGQFIISFETGWTCIQARKGWFLGLCLTWKERAQRQTLRPSVGIVLCMRLCPWHLLSDTAPVSGIGRVGHRLQVHSSMSMLPTLCSLCCHDRFGGLPPLSRAHRLLRRLVHAQKVCPRPSPCPVQRLAGPYSLTASLRAPLLARSFTRPPLVVLTSIPGPSASR